MRRSEVREIGKQVRVRPRQVAREAAPREKNKERVRGVIREAPAIGVSGWLRQPVLEHVGEIGVLERIDFVVRIAESFKELYESLVEACWLFHRWGLVELEPVVLGLVE